MAGQVQQAQAVVAGGGAGGGNNAVPAPDRQPHALKWVELRFRRVDEQRKHVGHAAFRQIGKQRAAVGQVLGCCRPALIVFASVAGDG